MTLKFERLVPSMQLLQERDGKWEIIGDSSKTLEETDYGKNYISGIKSLSIKYGMGFVSINVSFPIHQNMLQDISINDYDSEMSKIFEFDSLWKIKYGWLGSDSNETFTISDLKLLETGLDYDQELKSFIANFKLIPKFSYVLADMPLQMLKGYRDKLKLYVQDKKIEDDEYPSKFEGHPLSLGRVLSEILDEARQVVESKKISYGIAEAVRDWIALQEQSGGGEPTGTLTPTPPGVETEKQAFHNYISLDAKPIVSRRFMNAEADDVPKPEEMRLIMFTPKGSGDDGPNVDIVAREFNSEKMFEDSPLTKWTSGDGNLDMNVLQFINLLLSKNNFSLMTMPYNIDKEGKMGWTIIQSDFNNIGTTVNEGEWIGIDKLDKEGTNGNSDIIKFVQDFGLDGTEDSQIFDLHSHKSVVLSVSANIDAGRSTYATAIATQAMVDNMSSPGLETIKYNNSRFSLLARQSHELNLETIGIPQMKVGDNIAVKLGGVLFDGTYKILELEHKIDDNSFISSVRCIRLMKSTAQSSTTNQTDTNLSKEQLENVEKAFEGDPLDMTTKKKYGLGGGIY